MFETNSAIAFSVKYRLFLLSKPTIPVVSLRCLHNCLLLLVNKYFHAIILIYLVIIPSYNTDTTALTLVASKRPEDLPLPHLDF